MPSITWEIMCSTLHLALSLKVLIYSNGYGSFINLFYYSLMCLTLGAVKSDVIVKEPIPIH